MSLLMVQVARLLRGSSGKLARAWSHVGTAFAALKSLIKVFYKQFAASGARFQHPKPAKNLKTISNNALSFRPHTLVYHDCIMNSLTLLPPPNTSILTPNRVSNELQNLRELYPTQFVVLVRRKKEGTVNLPQIQIKKWAVHPDPSSPISISV